MYKHGVQLAVGRSAKEDLMDVLAWINPSMDGFAVLSLILPVMFISKRMPAQYSLFLSGDHCGFTSFEYMDQANLLGHYSRTKRVWCMYRARLARVWSDQLPFLLHSNQVFQQKDASKHRTLLFSLAIIVILHPLTTWIKRIWLVVKAEQGEFDGSLVTLFLKSLPLLKNMRVSRALSLGERQADLTKLGLI